MQEYEVPLVWVGVDELPILFTNHVVSQFQPPGEFIITLGQQAPPMILGEPEDQAEQAENLAFVAVRPVVRLGLTVERMRQLVDVMSQNLQSYEENLK